MTWPGTAPEYRPSSPYIPANAPYEEPVPPGAAPNHHVPLAAMLGVNEHEEHVFVRLAALVPVAAVAMLVPPNSVIAPAFPRDIVIVGYTEPLAAADIAKIGRASC